MADYKSELCPGCGVRNHEAPGEKCEDCQCDHEPVWASATCADSCDGIIDITCAKCGVSGSFQVSESDINW